MRNWNLRINLKKEFSILCVLSAFFLLCPVDAQALNMPIPSEYVNCYDDDTNDSLMVKGRVIGLHDGPLMLRQVVCESRISEWYNPRIRVVYGSRAIGFKAVDLEPNKCSWVKGLRFCARMAYPEEGRTVHGNDTGKDCDPEDNIASDACKSMKPQLCAYVDPMDGGDTKGGYSPYHHRTPADTIFSTGTSAGIGAAVGTLIMPGVGTAIGAAIGGLVNAIKSRKNHFVIHDLGCVDRPMAVGPPVWSNDQWDRVYLPAPFIDYSANSTFINPNLDLRFCTQQRSDLDGNAIASENVKCEFRKQSVDNAYGVGEEVLLREPDFTPVPVDNIRIIRNLNVSVNHTAANVRDPIVIGPRVTGPWERQFEARISFDIPDAICVYKVREARILNFNADGTPNYTGGQPVDELQGCLPRPGYMPLPQVVEVPDPLLGDLAMGLNPDKGILGLEFEVSFENMDGSINLTYLGDIDTEGGTVRADDATPIGPPEFSPRCDTLHQIEFCVAPGPVGQPAICEAGATRPECRNCPLDDPFNCGPPPTEDTVKYVGWLCLEGYSTAPLVAAKQYKEPDLEQGELSLPILDEEGQPVFDPPLFRHHTCPLPEDGPCNLECTPGLDCIQNPGAKPLTKYFMYSELIRGYDEDGVGPLDGTLDGVTLAGDIPNRYLDPNIEFTNHNTYQEIVAGVREAPTIELKVPSYHYEPPRTDEPPINAGLATLAPEFQTQRPVPPVEPYLVHLPTSRHEEYECGAAGPPDIGRDIDVVDPYTIGLVSIDYDRPNPADFDLTDADPFSPDGCHAFNELAEPDDAILRPMTPQELGLCARVTLDITKDYTTEDKKAHVFPSEKAVLEWMDEYETGGSATQMNEVIRPYELVKDDGDAFDDISNYEDGQRCSKVYVQVWGAGAGGTSQGDTAGDISGGAGGYVGSEYNLEALGLVDRTLEVSVGVGGDIIWLGEENIVGLDGTRSTFGPNDKMMVAEGGKGFAKSYEPGGTPEFIGNNADDADPTDNNDYVGGNAYCQAGCVAPVIVQGLNGQGHDDFCGIVPGGQYYGGRGEENYVSPGTEKCDHSAANFVDAYRDPDLFIDSLLGLSRADGSLWHRTNFNYSINRDAIKDSTYPLLPTETYSAIQYPSDGPYPSTLASTYTPDTFRHPGGGGCTSNKCTQCPAGSSPCAWGVIGSDCTNSTCLFGGSFPPEHRVGLAAPGSHGRVTVQCIEHFVRVPTTLVDDSIIPDP